MGLAEPRRKTKMSFDPNNTTWGEDTSKFGYQLMNKMGWQEGQGLGRDKTGSKDHIKVRVKNNALGVGAKQAHDDNWLELQASFNNLLENLAQSHEKGVDNRNTKVTHLEEKTSASRRIFYSRFVKSKDVSKYSSSDMASIFGERARTESPGPVTEVTETECSFTGVTTTTNSMSISDYFAQRMAERRSGVKAPQATFTEIVEEESTARTHAGPESDSAEASDEGAQGKGKKSKKEKKSKKRAADMEAADEADTKVKRKKSKKEASEHGETADDASAKKKKSKKSGEEKAKKSKKGEVKEVTVEAAEERKNSKKSKKAAEAGTIEKGGKKKKSEKKLTSEASESDKKSKKEKRAREKEGDASESAEKQAKSSKRKAEAADGEKKKSKKSKK